MENAKVVTTPLSTYFKLSVKQSLSNEIEKKYMVSYASTVGNLMYTMVCTRLKHYICCWYNKSI